MAQDSVKQAVDESLELIIDKEYIKEDNHLFDDLGIDNIDLVECVMDIEAKLNIRVPDDKIDTLCTIGDLYKLIEEIYTNN